MSTLRIVIAGGTGQVGSILTRHFNANHHHVTLLSRATRQDCQRVAHWDGTHLGEWVSELDGADVLINLSGRSVNCRYNRQNRREIMESRIQPTRLLGHALRQISRPPSLWINANTATIYRHSVDQAMDETGELGGNEPDAPPSWKFSIEVATGWERAFFSDDIPGVRRVAIRSAMVMSPDQGGIFDTLLRLVRFGMGGRAGSGNQFVSWIHAFDFCNAIDFLIQNETWSGVVNLASPQPLQNMEFMKALRQAWGTTIGIPATEWMLEVGALFLRTETELILKSRRVIPGRLTGSGFKFRFPDWPGAAKDLVNRWRDRKTYESAND
jgi:uncharacterized protein (TIGR01777 family)